MKLIKINSPEYRALSIEAISKQQTHVLRQLNAAAASGERELVVLDSFFDALVYSSIEGEPERAEIVSCPRFFGFLNGQNLEGKPLEL